MGLFLIASLSILGTNKGKSPMEHDINYVWYHYELDSKYENLFSKQKKEFKDKWDIYQDKNDHKNFIVLLKKSQIMVIFVTTQKNIVTYNFMFQQRK